MAPSPSPTGVNSQKKLIIDQHPVLSIFTSTPSVAFRRKKNISNFVTKNDVTPKDQALRKTKPCGRCKLCPLINETDEITNERSGITRKCHSGGNCKTRNVVYAARCKKHQTIYVGHTGESLATRFAKHRYDIAKRPNNSELAEHFGKDHKMNEDMDVVILQSDISNANARKRFEDKWICRLQTLKPSGMNQDHGKYAEEVFRLTEALASRK